MNSRNSIHARIDAEAAEWLVQLQDPEPEAGGPTGFLSWLQQSPRHVKAFLDISEASRQLDGLDAGQHIDVMQLLDERSAAVIALYGRNGPDKQGNLAAARGSKGRSAWRNRWAAAAALAALAVGGVLAWQRVSGPQTYATAVGEQRSIKLAEGSFMHLNTHSRAEVRFTRSRRQVRLLEGEALFVVERDAQRPFIVDSGTARVRVLGTRFNVYRRPQAIAVAVVEGSVQVTVEAANKRDAGSAPGVRLTAGQQVEVVADRIVRQTRAETADSLAWRERRLIFRNAPLSEVAAEFNRYNTPAIHAEGAAVRGLEITGIFSADHPQSLLLYLSRDESLAVERDGADWIIRRKH